jgi:hypothetical protein
VIAEKSPVRLLASSIGWRANVASTANLLPKRAYRRKREGASVAIDTTDLPGAELIEVARFF